MPPTPPSVATPPSVGRIVHYVAYGTPGGEFPAGICRAAIITEVYLGPGAQLPPTGTVLQLEADGTCMTVGLCVLNPTGPFFNRGVPYDDGVMTGTHKPGTWHWPERV